MSSNAQRPPNAQSANNAPIDWNGHSISKVFANDMNVRRILKYIKDPKDVFSLLNVNRPVRDGILNCRLHWGRFRRLIINRKFLPTHYPSQNKVFYDPELERYKRKMIESGEWPKHKYFERFGDFAFEEFIINKIMRMPYWFSPAMDSDYWDQIWEQKRFITTLVLDHTAVTGRGLFGSVAMPTGNDIYRTSSGLISYLMPHLKHLSLRYCPNVQHSDIAIYLILPPTSYLGPRELLTLRAYGCGEAPTEGPFQNLPGFGSKNKITQKSDNILNIKILALLFPSCLSIAHHKRHTLPHTVLGTDPRDTQRLIRAQENRLETLHRVGWLSMAVLQIFPPPLTLPDPLTGQPVSGPFGGFLASVHESIMLASICIYSNIKLDWKPFCVNRHDCASFKIENFTPVARINHRTGRTTGLGNLYGALAGRHVRRQDYHDFTDGVVPRIPVQLSNLIPGKEGMYIQYRAEVSKVPTEGENESQRERPAFLSMQGHRPAPDYYDPGITGEVCKMVAGLSGEGPHLHCAVGLGRRREAGGKVCANCGLWEYENYTWKSTLPTSEGMTIRNPGRQLIGEVCELCIPFFTCGDCGDFFCPSCLKDPARGELSNPWAAVQPSPNLLIRPCNVHGATCATCYFASRSSCNYCQKYICIECVEEDPNNKDWHHCSICALWVCKACTESLPRYKPGVWVTECGAFGWLPDGHKICVNCIGAVCRTCERKWCSACFKVARSKFITDHGAPMFTDREKLCTCQDCFERQLAWSKTELERINTWKFAGVNILQREHAAVKAAEIAYRRQKYKHLPPTELETREKLKALAAAQNNKLPGGKGPRIVELGSDDDMGDASDAASDESECDPETTGANHPILKKMDNLYDDLIKEVRAGGVIPQGMTELVRSIRNARHHIERSKIAEVEHKERRMRAKGLHKRVRSAEKDMDPRCDYSPETYFGPKRLYKDMVLTDTTGNPLPNSAYETEFTWIPTTMDMLAFEHKINTPEGKYWMSDTEMCRGDIAGCDFIWENWEYGDWFRPREAAIKAGRHKEIMWQATHVPKGFEVRKPKDGAKLKRKAEDPLAEIAEEWRENTNSGRRVRERAPEGEQTKKEEKTDKKGDKTDKKGEKTGKNDRKSAQQKEEKAAKAGGKSGGHLAEKTRQTVNAEKERYIRNQIHRLDAAFHEMEINGAAITQDETAKDPDTDRTVRFIKPIGRKWTKLGRDRDAREMETGKKAPPIAPQPPTKSALKKLKKEVKEAMKPVTRVIENDVKPLIAEAVYAGRNMGVDTASLVASTSAAATTKAGAYIPCVAPTVARGTAVRLGIARGRKPPVRARSNVPRTLDWEYQDERIADDDERGYIQ